jgi:hypothetical protein
MVEQDDYAGVGSILTDDATWTIVPIGYRWTGRRAIESMTAAAGGTSCSSFAARLHRS